MWTVVKEKKSVYRVTNKRFSTGMFKQKGRTENNKDSNKTWPLEEFIPIRSL